MNFVPSRSLHHVPHGSRFDFCGLLMFVGPSLRARRRSRTNDDGGGAGGGAEDGGSHNSDIYDAETGMLRDVTADASFSEFRMIVLRDGSDNGGDLCIKMYAYRVRQ